VSVEKVSTFSQIAWVNSEHLEPPPRSPVRNCTQCKQHHQHWLLTPCINILYCYFYQLLLRPPAGAKFIVISLSVSLSRYNVHNVNNLCWPITSRRQVARSPPNLHTMDSRSACIHGVLKVKVTWYGHFCTGTKIASWGLLGYVELFIILVKFAIYYFLHFNKVHQVAARLRAKSAIYNCLVIISSITKSNTLQLIWKLFSVLFVDCHIWPLRAVLVKNLHPW